MILEKLDELGDAVVLLGFLLLLLSASRWLFCWFEGLVNLIIVFDVLRRRCCCYLPAAAGSSFRRQGLDGGPGTRGGSGSRRCGGGSRGGTG